MLLARDMVDALAGVDRDVAFDVATGAAEPILWHEPSESFKATWAHRDKGREGNHDECKKVLPSPPASSPPATTPVSLCILTPPVGLVGANV